MWFLSVFDNTRGRYAGTNVAEGPMLEVRWWKEGICVAVVSRRRARSFELTRIRIDY